MSSFSVMLPADALAAILGQGHILGCCSSELEEAVASANLVEAHISIGLPISGL